MRILILSILCLATSMHAGKKDKAARKAEQAKIDAQNTAALAAAYKAAAATSLHEINCSGHCWKCDPGYMTQQGQYDRK